MAESALSMTIWNVLERVADSMGYTHRPGGDAWEVVKAIVESGYRQYLFPVIPAEKTPHKWSWLSPTATLALAADDYDYDLPEDFGGLVGTFTYAADVRERPIQIVGEGKIRELRAASDEDGDPWFVAVRPKAFTIATGQRWEAIFYPTPDQVRTMTYRYDVLLGDLWGLRASGTATISVAADDRLVLTDATATFTTTASAGNVIILDEATDTVSESMYFVKTVDTNTQITATAVTDQAGQADYYIYPHARYPAGGAQYCETFLAICMALAEKRRDDMAGVMSMEAERLLRAAVMYDRSHAPDYLGQNLDASDGPEFLPTHDFLKYQYGGVDLGP